MQKSPVLVVGILASAVAVGAAMIPATAQSQASVSPDQLSATQSFDRTVSVQAKRGVAVHRFDLDLPRGASLRPVPAEQGQRELVSEIQVTDKSGKVIGVIDSPWAQDANGNALFSYFRIEGRTLVQTIDASKAGTKPVTAVLMYAGAQTDHDGASAAPRTDGMMTIMAGPFVGIPYNYVYNPRLGALHDYCTASPDEFPNPFGPNANFRGPCARHDMCYAGTTSEYTCDVNLRENMRINCRYSYGTSGATLTACYRTADVYFAAVVAAS